MISPFRKHQLSTRAHLAAMAAGAVLASGAAPAMPEEGDAASEYRNLLAQLHEDLRALQTIQSTDAKVAKKRELIDNYLPWCEGALTVPEGQAAPQDEIVVTIFIWALDLREWGLALDLYDHVASHALQLPERFHRSPRALLWSEMADAAIGEPGLVPHDVLLRAQPGADPVPDVKDETIARMFRAIGESWSRQAEAFDPNAESAPAGGKAMLIDAALTAMREATRIHANVGVKKQIEQLEREAKKLAPSEAN